eukprot:Tamp_09288.p6 GENE.Tamp_09288~~Tamp_09288.p6  ORF type:complete len:110 (+),score=16.13 Tamp_09288:339-668(+)
MTLAVHQSWAPCTRVARRAVGGTGGRCRPRAALTGTRGTSAQRLVRHVQALLDEEAHAQRVDLLAFHRWRNDQGPGTSKDPDDAAHFSVRSPYPTLQLLKDKDLRLAML